MAIDLFGLKKRRRKQELERLSNLMRAQGLLLTHKSAQEVEAWRQLFKGTEDFIGDIGKTLSYDPWARRAVDLIGNFALAIPLVVKNKAGITIEEGAMAFFAKDPFLNMTYADGLYQTLGWLLTTGKALWQIETKLNNTIDGLWVIPGDSNLQRVPNQSASKLDQVKHPTLSYLYAQDRIILEEGIWLYLWTPKEAEDGEGLLASARYYVGANIEAARMTYTLLKEGGIPPHYLGTALTLSDDEFNQIKTQIDSILRGATNIKQLPLLPGGFEIKSVQQSARDMQLTDLRKHNREAIATALGVAINLLTSGTTTFENQKQAKVLVYESVIRPLLKKLASYLNERIAPAFDKNLHFAFDFSEVQALQPEYSKYAQAIPNLLKVMEEDEVREISPFNLPSRKTQASKESPITIGKILKQVRQPKPQSKQISQVFDNKWFRVIDRMVDKQSGESVKEILKIVRNYKTKVGASWNGNKIKASLRAGCNALIYDAIELASDYLDKPEGELIVDLSLGDLCVEWMAEKVKANINIKPDKLQHLIKQEVAIQFRYLFNRVIEGVLKQEGLTACNILSLTEIQSADIRQAVDYEIQRKAYFLERKAEFDTHVKSFGDDLQNLYKRQEKEVNKYLKDFDAQLTGLSAPSDWLDWPSEVTSFKDMAQPKLTKTFSDSGNVIQEDFRLTLEHEKQLKDYSQKFAVTVNDTTLDELNEAYREAMAVTTLSVKQDEEEEPKTKKAILLLSIAAIYDYAQGARTDVSAWRETHNAQSFGLVEGGRQAGKSLKRWLSAFLDTTRPDHADADGQEVGLDAPFEVGGEALMWPGDAAGSVKNTANCYCTVEFFDAQELALRMDNLITKPYPDEHACRLVSPKTLSKHCRRVNGGTGEKENPDQKHKGKYYDVIFCRKKNSRSSVRQAIRYPLEHKWTVAQARKHCKENKGILFEPAAKEKKYIWFNIKE